LKRLKRELTEKIWNRHTTSHKKEDIQQESIFQGFRMVGTITKNGDRATAHRVGDKVSLEYLNKFVAEGNFVTFNDNQ
jgi:D-arabinose 1-dehydrogenase-like Zn-dependent alcohol dehydrogenase